MRRRYKFILIIFISFLFVFLIYVFCKKERFIYVSLGDNLAFPNFSTYNYSEYLEYYFKKRKIEIYEYTGEYNLSEDLYKQIIENNKDISYYLKNAQIITLSLGTVELNNFKDLNEDIIISYLSNIYILLEKISKLNKNVFLINMYDNRYSLINKKLKEYARINNIFYIDRTQINETYIYQKELKTYLNYKGHKKIADIIVKQMDTRK